MKRAKCVLAVILLAGFGVVGWAEAQIPPGSLLWLRADTGVEQDATGVLTWQDQSGNLNHARRCAGAPQLAAANFGDPPADHPVMRFDGDDAFALMDSGALRAAEITICAVLSTRPDEGGSFYSNYDDPVDWGNGVNAEVRLPTIYWFTTAGTKASYSAMSSASLSEAPYRLVTLTYGPGGKNIFVDGTCVGSAAAGGLDYGVGSVASIGQLGKFNLFSYKGDIAELLVYGEVDAQQQAQVESYLKNKYLAPEAGTMSLLAAALLTLWRRRQA